MPRFHQIILITLLIMPVLALAGFDWQTLKTEHFTVFFKPGHEWQARKALEALEANRPFVEKLTGNQALHVPVVIEDLGSTVNGMTDPLGYGIYLYASPPTASLGSYTQDWWANVGVHEYTHMLHLTKTGGLPAVLKVVFGNVAQPNMFSPDWLIEGTAVYSESQLSPQQGRLNEGYYDAYMAASARDGRLPSIVKATNAPLDFPLEGSYLYGGEFMNYLTNHYGQDKLARYFTAKGSSALSFLSPILPCFGDDYVAGRIYGKSLPRLWREWLKDESAQSRDAAVTRERLTRRGWWVEGAVIAEGKLYYKTMSFAKVGVYDNIACYQIRQRNLASGKDELIKTTSTYPTRPLKLSGNQLYYAVDETGPGYANSNNLTYGIHAVIHRFDLASHKDDAILCEDVRGFTVLADDTIIYSQDRPDGFGSRIYEFKKASKEKTLLFETALLVDEIDADGKRVVALARPDGENYGIYELDIGKQELYSLVRTQNMIKDISLCGDRLLFSANFNKVYSVYCFNFADSRVYRLGNDFFATHPAYDVDENRLYYTGLTSYGFDLFSQSADFLPIDLPFFASAFPQAPLILENQIKHGGYGDDLVTMVPAFRFPYIHLDTARDLAKVGVGLVGKDALDDFPLYKTYLVYDIKNREPEGFFSLESLLLAPGTMGFTYNDLEQRYLLLDYSYPILYHLDFGLDDLLLGLSTRLWKNQKSPDIMPRRELAGQIVFGLHYPTTTAMFSLNYPVERKQWGSAINRDGWYGELAVDQIAAGSKIHLDLHGIYDPDNPDNGFIKIIRGYDYSLVANVGGTSTLSLTIPLVKIRDGFWNPNVYWEDLFGTVFCDTAVAKDGDYQLLYGAELHIETKLFFGFVPLDMGIRLAFNRAGSPLSTFFVTTPDVPF